MHRIPRTALIAVLILGLWSALFVFRDAIWWTWKPTDSRATVILIVLDDLDWDLVADDWLRKQESAAENLKAPSFTPRFPVLHEMADSGLVFTNFHSTTPVCGPARASILSGQYASRHRVRVNRPHHPTSHGFPGGFREYGRNRDFARFVRSAGYQTCFVGKYVHDGFEPNPDTGVTWRELLPSGWDRFHACLGAQYHAFWSVDSATEKTTRNQTVFRSDYEADRVIDMLSEQAATKQSQLVCWFSLIPHDSSATEVAYPARLATLYQDEIPPAWSRQPNSQGLDLPKLLRDLPQKLTVEQENFIVEKWRERLRSLKAFDESLGRVREHLAKQGRLENTVFLVTSDHGYRLGDHGHVGKRLPYDRITRVPLLVSGTGVTAGRCDQLLANIDLAPTIIELMAGARSIPDSEMDGRSFASLLRNPDSELSEPRTGILFECWEAESVWGQRVPCVWTSLRTANTLYTEWASGDREYYELDRDPEQLKNGYDSLTAEATQRWQTQLQSIRTTDRSPLLGLPSDEWNALRTESHNPTYHPLEIMGFVDADQGIERVELEVFDRVSKQFWNGERWSAVKTRVATEIRNPSGILSRWDYQLKTPIPGLDRSVHNEASTTEDRVMEHRIRISIIATGRNGQETEWVDESEVLLRPTDPETWIRQPTFDAADRVSIRGLAAGKVRFVRLVIQDKLEKTYWNGQGWVSEFTQVNANLGSFVNGQVEWNYDFLGHSENDLYIAARAVDFQGNFDQTVAFVELGEKGVRSEGRNVLPAEK